MTLGVYEPGTSLLHRLPAGVKLLGLGAAILAMTLVIREPLGVGVAVASVVVLFGIGRIPPRTAWRQIRPLLWFLAFILVFQVIFTDWRRAVVVCGVLLASVALAALITLTTRTTAMLDAITGALGPLRRFGVPVDHFAMALALAIRSIPLMVDAVRQVDEARQARGLRPGPRILIAPIVLVALATADGFADTLTARGMD